MASEATTAPEDLEEGQDEAQAKPAPASWLGRLKGMSRKQMMLYAGGIVVALGLAYGGLLFFGGDKEGTAAPEVFYHDLPEMVINLSATNERPQYLRVRMTLEIEDPAVLQVLDKAMPRVVDTFQVHLRELRAADLDGSAGLFRLREELMRRVNQAIAPQRVRAVLFRELVVQ